MTEKYNHETETTSKRLYRMDAQIATVMAEAGSWQDRYNDLVADNKLLHSQLGDLKERFDVLLDLVTSGLS